MVQELDHPTAGRIRVPGRMYCLKIMMSTRTLVTGNQSEFAPLFSNNVGSLLPSYRPAAKQEGDDENWKIYFANAK